DTMCRVYCALLYESEPAANRTTRRRARHLRSFRTKRTSRNRDHVLYWPSHVFRPRLHQPSPGPRSAVECGSHWRAVLFFLSKRVGMEFHRHAHVCRCHGGGSAGACLAVSEPERILRMARLWLFGGPGLWHLPSTFGDRGAPQPYADTAGMDLFTDLYCLFQSCTPFRP